MHPSFPPIFSTDGAESAQFCLFRTRTSWSSACNHQSETSAIFEAVFGAARHIVVHTKYLDTTQISISIRKIFPVYVCISPFKFPHLSAHSDSSANSSDTSILTESTPNPSSVSSFFIFYLLYRDQRRGSRRSKKHTGIITELNFFLLKICGLYIWWMVREVPIVLLLGALQVI